MGLGHMGGSRAESEDCQVRMSEWMFRDRRAMSSVGSFDSVS